MIVVWVARHWQEYGRVPRNNVKIEKVPIDLNCSPSHSPYTLSEATSFDRSTEANILTKANDVATIQTTYVDIPAEKTTTNTKTNPHSDLLRRSRDRCIVWPNLILNTRESYSNPL